MSIEGAVAATVVLALVALLIAPFSAIFVLAAGAVFIAAIAIWGRREASGETEGVAGRAEGEERLRQAKGRSGVAGQDSGADADPVASRSGEGSVS